MKHGYSSRGFTVLKLLIFFVLTYNFIVPYFVLCWKTRIEVVHFYYFSLCNVPYFILFLQLTKLWFISNYFTLSLTYELISAFRSSIRIFVACFGLRFFGFLVTFLCVSSSLASFHFTKVHQVPVSTVVKEFICKLFGKISSLDNHQVMVLV